MPRIAILGGSFNPPHLGHVEIARYVLDRHLADEVWVLPAAAHPYAKPLAKFADRMEMCRLAFQGIPHVVVSDVESKLPPPSYTIQTVRHITKTVRPEPVEGQIVHGSTSSPRTERSHQFFLIVGSDIIADIPNWKDSAEILKLATLIEVPRGPNSPIPDVSATAVRERIARGDDLTDQIPETVARYIQSKRLYR